MPGWARLTDRNGDLNLLGPFIPFASPFEPSWMKAAKIAYSAQKKGQPFIWPPTEKSRIAVKGFQYVMNVFAEQRVGIVVRLNDEL
jgi:cell division cycle 14